MPNPPTLLIVAHVSDAVIGAGAQLPRFSGPRILSLARLDQTRATEAQDALRLAGIAPENIHTLGLPNQQISANLAGLSRLLATTLLEIEPHVIVTQAYEGGHPDHDATAFGVHCALRLLLDSGVPHPSVTEFPSYHLREGRLRAGEFHPPSTDDETTLVLSSRQQTLKRKMLSCLKQEREGLAVYSMERETFRVAPRYDFTRPPHDGPLFYEQFDWAMTGERWRGLARLALENLAIRGTPWV